MHFRPGDIPQGDPDPGSPVDWEDNWLSNLMAWVSFRFLKKWCQTPEHWTSRVTQYLFTDCPCCILFRGITVGFVLCLMIMTVILFVVLSMVV
jgi:hypothetical protein